MVSWLNKVYGSSFKMLSIDKLGLGGGVAGRDGCTGTLPWHHEIENDFSVTGIPKQEYKSATV